MKKLFLKTIWFSVFFIAFVTNVSAGSLSLDVTSSVKVGDSVIVTVKADSMAGKLPIGPICNPSIISIEASINPTENDYYYFVADKNAKIYYTKTLQEHNAKVAELKKNGHLVFIISGRSKSIFPKDILELEKEGVFAAISSSNGQFAEA